MVLPQRGRTRRAAIRRGGGPAGLGLRPPRGRRVLRAGLALQRRRTGRFVAFGRPDQHFRARYRLRRQWQRRLSGQRGLPGHLARRRRPVVRAGVQPAERPGRPQRRGRLADRRLLRLRLRRRSRLARTEHRRARREQRGHAGGVPLVPGRLGLLHRRGGGPLLRRQQRDRQRRRLQRRPGLRPDLRQRRAHPHPLERRQRGSALPGRRCHLRVRHQPEHRPVVAGGRAVPGRRRRGHRHRRRELLRRQIGLPQDLRPQHGVRPGLERHPQRGDHRLARAGRRAGQRPARRGGGDDRQHHLRPQRSQRRGDLGRADQRSGDRLPRDGRPHRRGIPGRDRPDFERDRRLRRAVGHRGGDPRSQRRRSRTRHW